MAPGHRGRPLTIPIEFIREQGWDDYSVGRPTGDRKDMVLTKYFKHRSTGEICRSAAEVNRILNAKGIYYKHPTEGKVPGSRLLIREPEVTNPDLRRGDPTVDAVRDAKDDNVGNFQRNPVANDVAPRDANIADRQDEAEVQHYHHRRMKRFDLNIKLNSDGEEEENPGADQE